MTRTDRWRLGTSELIDQCEELELERDEARRVAAQLWRCRGWLGLEEDEVQSILEGYPWLKERNEATDPAD